VAHPESSAFAGLIKNINGSRLLQKIASNVLPGTGFAGMTPGTPKKMLEITSALNPEEIR
jgi:hypothetical protein